jgi:dCMP deaminase
MTDRQIEEFLAMAYEVATKSPDPSSQNGALIVSPGGQLLTEGWNTFPHGVELSEDRLNDRQTKYKYIEHAERNAIYAHTWDHNFISTDGLTMVCPWAACFDCARAIIQSKIRRVITHRERMDQTAERWGDNIKTSIAMLEEAGVRFDYFDGPVRYAPAILVDGELWRPDGVKSATN